MTIETLRKLGFCEGVSLLALLFFAMPLKYLAGMAWVVSVVGMIHGVLFIAYVALAARVCLEHGFGFVRWILLCGVASIPFGPFVFDRRLFPRVDL
jgi:integral membrane protein